MNSTVMAIYENGVLRPLTPLTLPERTQVRLHVEQVSATMDIAAHRRQVRGALVAAGLSLPVPDTPPPAISLSAERREELAHLFSADRPLSRLIIEERDENPNAHL